MTASTWQDRATHCLLPHWPAPGRVRALTTTRRGGVSEPPHDSWNLADHVGDRPDAVGRNRAILCQRLGLDSMPAWLQQVHSNRVVQADALPDDCPADGAWTRSTGTVCAVLTADCLPVLLCDRGGTRVAAVHAGWRGLLAGVIEAAVDALETRGDELLAWLGPAIGPGAFQVGDEVRDAFLGCDPRAGAAFASDRSGYWRADLYELGRQRLASRGVSSVYGGGRCSYTDSSHFYSYRRDGTTGRMASLIWLCEE